MADTKIASERTQQQQPAPPPPTGWLALRSHILLVPILLLSAALEFYGLDQEGYANTYYAAAVKSMLTSWHNFFFLAFDPTGFVALDKAPLGFWLQAISAKLFGFNGVSLLLPQALAGVLSVLLLYHLVTRTFGPTAGLIASLVLALTPITVVIDRNNTIDSLLVLTLLLAAWTISLAAETGRLRWLLFTALLLALAFNIKMLQAYLVLPAFALLFLFGSPRRLLTRLWHLALAAVVMLIISFSWAIVVDLTPASQRPYVSNSGTNSVVSLVFGYNGLARLSETLLAHFAFLHALDPNIDLTLAPSYAPGIGDASFFRLLHPGISDQVSWLLIVSVFGLFAAFTRIRWRLPLDRRAQGIILWGGWLLTVGAYFSFARFFYLYYLTMLAPALATLVGIGLVSMWNEYRTPGWRKLLLPAALFLTLLSQGVMLGGNLNLDAWLIPIILSFLPITFIPHFVALWERAPRVRIIQIATVIALLAMLVAPTVWDIGSIQANAASAWLPAATSNSGYSYDDFGGPDFGGDGGFNGFGNGPQMTTFAGPAWNVLDPRLLSYLQQQQAHTRYLVATPDSSYASVFMLATNQPALALGGYQGWDRILTPTALATLVHNNSIRFFYLPTNQPDSGNPASINNDLYTWVQQTCKPVPTNLWQTPGSNNDPNNPDNNGGNPPMNLYHCT